MDRLLDAPVTCFLPFRIGWACVTLFDIVPNDPKRVYVYVDESGRGRPDNRHNPNQPFFIVGALITAVPAALKEIVELVCTEENFRRELHWREFNRTAARVYGRVATAIDQNSDWEYKATRFKASEIDFRFFGGESREARAVNGEHYAYNVFVKHGVKAALRFSPIMDDVEELEIIIDEKHRTKEDNFQEYLRRSLAEMYPGVDVVVRDCPSHEERLVQVCDIISGAHNTLLVRAAREAKIAAAQRVWLGRCQQFHCRLKNWAE
ncbi:MAG: DUF3800 domain-containing protein [Candidatus Cybelea sp.]